MNTTLLFSCESTKGVAFLRGVCRQNVSKHGRELRFSSEYSVNNKVIIMPLHTIDYAMLLCLSRYTNHHRFSGAGCLGDCTPPGQQRESCPVVCPCVAESRKVTWKRRASRLLDSL